jgi:DNA-binding NarL/FixJ family response regulator
MYKDVLILDSQRLYVDGLAQLISHVPGFQVAATATDGVTALQSYAARPVELVVAGIHSSCLEELDTIRAFKRWNPRVKIVLLVNALEVLKKVFQADALGYILKTDGKQELAGALRYAAEGLPYFSERVAHELTRMGAHRRGAPEPENDPAMLSLTRREWEIITLVAREYSSYEIGEMLCISPMTVNTHRRNLMKKLGVKSALGLVKYALANAPAEVVAMLGE